MTSLAPKRIQKELADLAKSNNDANSIRISVVDDDLMHLQGTINGPPGTPYEGATYKLKIDIPDNYPFAPPVVKFINRIWHPNISSATGVICLDILKSQWAAAMSLRTILLSIQALLDDPEPSDPQDAVVANQYKSDRMMFNKTAKHWAHIYADGPKADSSCTELIEKMVGMGFTEDDARSALSTKNWNITEATDHLIS